MEGRDHVDHGRQVRRSHSELPRRPEVGGMMTDSFGAVLRLEFREVCRSCASRMMIRVCIVARTRAISSIRFCCRAMV